jgi:hypothetical protein
MMPIDPHKPHEHPPHRSEEPRIHRPSPIPDTTGLPAAVQTPDEPVESERSEPTPTRTIRNGEIQGHPRELPGDRDSQ